MKNATRNWKTSLLGLLALMASVAPIWAPAEYQDRIQKTAVALAGAGLLAAKDGDKSGTAGGA